MASSSSERGKKFRAAQALDPSEERSSDAVIAALLETIKDLKEILADSVRSVRERDRTIAERDRTIGEIQALGLASASRAYALSESLSLSENTNKEVRSPQIPRLEGYSRDERTGASVSTETVRERSGFVRERDRTADATEPPERHLERPPLGPVPLHSGRIDFFEVEKREEAEADELDRKRIAARNDFTDDEMLAAIEAAETLRKRREAAAQ